MISRATATRVVALLAAIGLGLAGGWDAEAHSPGVVLSASGSPTVDGVLTPGEWDRAARVDFNASLPAGGTVPATLFVMNDRTTLFVAVRVNTPIDPTDTKLTIVFDNAHRGQNVVGDDAIVVTPGGGAGDAFVTSVSGGRFTATGTDPSGGGATNGSAVFVNNGVTSVYEVSHPLSSGDPKDFGLAIGNTVAFSLALLILQGGLHPTTTQFPAEPQPFGDIVILSPVRLTLPSTTIRTGEGFAFALEAQNFDTSAVDLYFGAFLPDGRTVVFFSAPGVIGRLASFTQPLQFLAMQAISPRGTVSVPSVTMATTGVPPGVYQLFAVLVRQGAFVDNRIDAGDILAFDVKIVTVTP
jgi:hypothetical protein